ncbi:hypothetical protein [Hyphomonas atlantica]|uniref:hypothetical protein n=1 Tax=Hyphomonas atlantica TaxID=1280948 RepID=UPI0035147159
MAKESIKLAGQSALAISASVEGASDEMPVILAHGWGQPTVPGRGSRRFSQVMAFTRLHWTCELTGTANGH